MIWKSLKAQISDILLCGLFSFSLFDSHFYVLGLFSYEDVYLGYPVTPGKHINHFIDEKIFAIKSEADIQNKPGNRS